jgi:hypothetical protein
MRLRADSWSHEPEFKEEVDTGMGRFWNEASHFHILLEVPPMPAGGLSVRVWWRAEN